MLEPLFFFCLALIAYGYVGYPLVLVLLDRALGQPVQKADITPAVSLVIAAYNEERDIDRKLENALALDYPKNKLEIMVVSDCSTDRTDEIVQRFYPRVKLCRLPHRLGKTIAQNRAVAAATGEILVFSDATTIYHPQALRKLLRGFADPIVGCVAGQLVYQNQADSAVGSGCASYWSYEKVLRTLESRVSSLIGVSGCIYAVRRSCYTELAREMSSDFVISAEIRLQSLRTAYEPEAICYEYTNQKSKDEFRMRVRVIEQTFTVLAGYRELLNPWRYGMFAFQLLSHKVARYLVPWLLLLTLILNIVLTGTSPLYIWTLAVQAAFYGAALLGLLLERMGRLPQLLGMPYYFVLANAAAAAGLIKFVRGESHIVWEPIRENGARVNA